MATAAGVSSTGVGGRGAPSLGEGAPTGVVDRAGNAGGPPRRAGAPKRPPSGTASVGRYLQWLPPRLTTQSSSSRGWLLLKLPFWLVVSCLTTPPWLLPGGSATTQVFVPWTLA